MLWCQSLQHVWERFYLRALSKTVSNFPIIVSSRIKSIVIPGHGVKRKCQMIYSLSLEHNLKTGKKCENFYQIIRNLERVFTICCVYIALTLGFSF